MEHLDEVCLGIRGETVGMDMDYPSIVLPNIAN